MERDNMIDPWAQTEIDDYSKVMKEFGIERFDPSTLPSEPNPPRLFRKNIVFGQRGFNTILGRIRSGGDFAILSGLMPSGRMHLGHKMVIDQIKYLQNFNPSVFIAVADIEAYATRGMPLKKARTLAIESYVKSYLGLGLNVDKLEIYFQSKRSDVKDIAYLAGTKVNLSTMKAIYGFNDSTNMAHMHSPLIQAGDILHPQVRLGPIPVVVPVGVDQDPHIRLCRDLASSFRMFNATVTSDGKVGVFVKVDDNVESLLSKARSALERLGYLDFNMVPRYKALYLPGASPSDVPIMDEALALVEKDEGGFGFIPPSSTYHRFINGITGEKMSSSKPETAIFLDDEPAEGAKKLKKAVTGGRDTAEEQREKGGRPDICAVFNTMMYHLVQGDEEIDRIREECLQGTRLCGSCKKEACQYLEEFLNDFIEIRGQREHLVREIVKWD